MGAPRAALSQGLSWLVLSLFFLRLPSAVTPEEAGVGLCLGWLHLRLGQKLWSGQVPRPGLLGWCLFAQASTVMAGLCGCGVIAKAQAFPDVLLGSR